MNLLMRENEKTMHLTNRIPIYQFDSSINDMRILVPKWYKNYNLSEFACTMNYMLPDGTMGIVSVLLDDEMYNDKYLSYHLTPSEVYTSQVGHINMEFVFTKTIDDIPVSLTLQVVRIPVISNNEASGDIDQSVAALLESQIQALTVRVNQETERINDVENNGINIVL